MQIQLITKEQMATTTWSGGTTTQFAIHPAQCAYASRDFLWRVSSATVDLAESDFTMLPAYNRLITTLQGEIRLRHEAEDPITLAPYAVHAFDGAVHTHSWGICRDFNLMLRKGQCRGQMEAVRLEAGEEGRYPAAEDCTLLFYPDEGAVRIPDGAEAETLFAGQCVLAQLRAGETLRVHALHPVRGIVCRMICAE